MAIRFIEQPTGRESFIKAGGTGTEADPYLLELDIGDATIESASLTAIETAVEIIDNMISGNEAQVDVVTLPGTTQADIAAIKTAIEILDNVVSGSETQVDIVASIPAGENHIGKVTGNSQVISFTLSLDTSAYASGDVLADTQEIPSVMRINEGTSILFSLVLNDKDDQGAAMTLLFLNANVSIGTENAAPSIADNDADSILGTVSVATNDWIDLGGTRIASIKNIGLGLKGASSSTSIYLAVITNGTPTHTASGITGKLFVMRD